MSITIQTMTIQDYDAARALWAATPGLGLSSADTPDAIEQYLVRNPDLSFVALDGPALVGTVMGGHDGRRGYLYHLAVDPAYRRQGIGGSLTNRCLEALRACGIEKCHILVFGTNASARAFWSRSGWTERTELVIMSHYTSDSIRND